jgi:aryl-alcohol dehydrogenase-like predicted oxidoreductase
MQERQLGRSGLYTRPLALGGNVFGWTADVATSHSILDAFVDGGFTLIDTADMYSNWVPGHQGGESEAIIGSWLKGRPDRDRILIATKVGADMGPAGTGLSRQYIERAVEASLRRLNTDYIDLYQTHYDDEQTPIEETLETYARLVKAGKVRAIGVSNLSPARIEASLRISAAEGYPRYETVQPLYNLYDREPFESELRPLCQREGLGVISYYALASGFLTGKYRSQEDIAKSKRARSNSKYLTPRGLRILDALDQVAEARGLTPAEIAFAWVAARPTLTAPIASATSIAQLEFLMAASRLSLNMEELEVLDAASVADPQDAAAGG